MLVFSQQQQHQPHRQERRPAVCTLRTAQLCDRLQTLVAATLSVPIGELRAPTRRSPLTAFARQIAMYLTHVVLAKNYSETGRLFGRDRTTVKHACFLVEERRDDPAIDALLQSLEDACAELACGSPNQAGPQA